MAETTPRKKVSDNIIDSCRCCNSVTDPHRRLGLFGKKSLNEGLVAAIKQLSGIVVSEEDMLSNFICRTCANSIPNLSKRVTQFRNKCTDTEKKQREKIASTREKRGRKNNPEEVEQSPRQPAKKALIEKRVARSLEEGLRRIAPKPGQRLFAVPSPPTSTFDVQPPLQHHSTHHPAEPPLTEDLAIISKSGLLGIKV